MSCIEYNHTVIDTKRCMVAIASLNVIPCMVWQVPDAGNGFFSYRILPTIMDRHPSAAGYLFINDDSLLNYWNLRDANLTKIWFVGEDSPTVFELGKSNKKDWYTTKATQSTVAKAYETVPLPYLMKLRTNVKRRCVARNVDPEKAYLKIVTDVYYIPNRHAAVFKELAQYFLTARVYSEASTTIPYFPLQVQTHFLEVSHVLSDQSVSNSFA